MAHLSASTLDALNQHIRQEFASSHEYLAASAHFADQDLPGMANWMRRQSEEERMHAMRFFDHILKRGGQVVLDAIPAPAAEFGSPLTVFERALEREQATSDHINKLYAYALGHDDYALQIFLQWFVQEQVEEEDAVRHIVSRLQMVGDDKGALMILDQQLADRRDPE